MEDPENWLKVIFTISQESLRQVHEKFGAEGSLNVLASAGRIWEVMTILYEACPESSDLE